MSDYFCSDKRKQKELCKALSEFYGPNAGYILELYDRYQRDPQSVDSATRTFFAHWSPPADDVSAVPARPEAQAATPVNAATFIQPGVQTDKLVGAVNYAQAIRSYGHLAARLDPLGGDPPGDPALLAETHGITESDLAQLPASLVGGPIAAVMSNALDAIRALRTIYSGAIGY